MRRAAAVPIAANALVCKRFANSVRISDFAMPFPLLLEIRWRGEIYSIEDAAGPAIAYFYFEGEHALRRALMKRLTEAEAGIPPF